MLPVAVEAASALEVDPDFVGPAALAKAYRFVGDPRDGDTVERLLELALDVVGLVLQRRDQRLLMRRVPRFPMLRPSIRRRHWVAQASLQDAARAGIAAPEPSLAAHL